MNDLIFLYYKRILYRLSIAWTNLKFYITLNNPCYRSVWFNKMLEKFLIIPCICCTVTRSLIVGFIVGFIFGALVL